MKRRRLGMLAVVAVVGAVVALLATGVGRGSSVAASPLVGHVAPDFTLPGVDGPGVTLSKLRGQVVLINFWASWCGECHNEQAALNDTWEQFRDSGVVVVGIDFQDTTGAARDYVHDAGITYPTVEDADSHTALAYGIRGIPETFVVDRSGHVVDRVVGSVDAEDLGRRIDTLLRAGAG